MQIEDHFGSCKMSIRQAAASLQAEPGRQGSPGWKTTINKRQESVRMKKRLRKGMSLLMMVLLLLSLLPAGVMAAEKEAALSLEQAIQKVKQNFTIPAEYTEFTSSFRSRDNIQIWSLSWTDKENRLGSFNAEVDATAGLITSMHIYKQGRQTTEIPAVSIDQARQIGLELLKKLIPDRVAELQYVPNQQIISLSSWQGGQYELRWQRMANQIPVGNEGVTLQISTGDGTVNSYDLNWSDKIIPAKTEFISAEKAAEVFAANKMLELQYYIAPKYSILREGDEKAQPLLVYRLMHNSGGMIDAASGQPIENQSIYGINDVGGMGSMEKSPAPQADLSPQEQAEVERTLNLISQEKAVSMVKQWVSLPANVKLEEANLYKDYQDPEKRTWNLNWRNDTEVNSSAYVSAQVDAVSGEIRNFYIDRGDLNDVKPMLDKAAAERIARDFLARIQPSKQNSVRLEKDVYQEIYVKESPYPAQWQFQFTRLENSIPCLNQGISIAVDGRSKQVSSYRLEWPTLTFSDPAQVMNMEKANQVYLQHQPLTMRYELTYPNLLTRNESSGEYKLVYIPRAEVQNQSSNMFDAVSGEPLSWDGTPVAEALQPQAFTDIAGHFAEKEISMLGQAGIMTEYGTTFHPHETINLVTMLRVMVMARNGYYEPVRGSDEEIIDQALRSQWLKEKMDPQTPMTTGLLAQLMVRMLDVDFIANMPSPALQAPFRDFNSMDANLQGYAALCWGLGIIKGDGVNFNAAHHTTRGEAAAVLVRTLTTANQKSNF